MSRRIDHRHLATLLTAAAVAACAPAAAAAPIGPIAGWQPPRPTHGPLPGAPAAPAVTWQVLVPPDGATFGFVPSTVVIRPGDHLALSVYDLLPHTVTARRTDAAGNPLFSSDAARNGQSVPVRGVERLAPGTYQFFCTIHPQMTGELVVTG